MSSARLGAVAAKMDALVAAREFPGITAVIARRGRVVFQHSTGVLDVETGAPMRDDSLLRVYSMTKPITSVAAMMLVEDGELLLDAPVTRFFPEWRNQTVLVDGENVPAARAVTARHLLMHTSGLTYGYYGDTPVDRMYREARLIDDWDYLTHDTRELVAKLADIPLLFQPGSRWHYGFSSDVLGHLVERVSGSRWTRSSKSGCSSRWAWATATSTCRPRSSTVSERTTTSTTVKSSSRTAPARIRSSSA